MIGRVLNTAASFLCFLYTMDSQPTDKVEGGQGKSPTQKKRNSYARTVEKADTPTVTVTEGNEQYCAPWIVESPGGTVTTYTDIQCRNRRRQKTVQTVSAVAKTLPTTPTHEREIATRVKGYCTDRSIFTMLRCTTDELFFSCCDSVAAQFKHAATRPNQSMRKTTVETCVDNIAKLRPQASVLAPRAAGANQRLNPALTTPRSYGRRHRYWHHGHVHATHSERRRGQRPLHHDQVHAWRLGHRHGHHDQAPATHNERLRGKRPGRNDEVTAMHNERRREQWPEHHDTITPPL
jgi:hypothetical protein